MENRLIPVVNGDVIFDRATGGTILSTEDVFALLVDELHPDRIILASREPGVWKDYPENKHLATSISLSEFRSSSIAAGGSAGTDVTGGMAKKIGLMMDILSRNPAIEITITGGMDNHSLLDALEGRPTGTRLQKDG